MKRLTLSIQNPCNENWDNMEPRSIGKHCLSCNKTVVDFTNFTDEQLLQFFQKPQESICGRIEEERLNSPLILPVLPKKNRIQWLFPLTAVLSIFGIGKVKAQDSSNLIKPVILNNTHEKVLFDENNQLIKVKKEFIEIMVLDKNRKVLINKNIKVKYNNSELNFNKFDSLNYTIEEGLIKIPTSQFRNDKDLKIQVADSTNVEFIDVSQFAISIYNIVLDTNSKAFLGSIKSIQIKPQRMGYIVVQKKRNSELEWRTLSEKIRNLPPQY